jgi:hypothetical protein
MACQLPTECLDEIFKYLKEDRLTLHSCLLVNRHWCTIAVRILWRNGLDFKCSHYQRPFRESSSILSTLIACLPNESKVLLHKNQISIPTPTSNLPLFNYPEFCNILSINDITIIVHNNIKGRVRKSLVANEIIKMFTNQTSLKKFTYCYDDDDDNLNLNISFPYVSGARDLLELCCSSNLSSEFFYQLSQTCHNLQSISILFDNDVSNELNELKELISLQNNLKNLTLSAFEGYSWAKIIPAIKKHSQTITKLQLYGDYGALPFSFVSSFTNLREFIFSFINKKEFIDFEKLQYANFPKLEVLKFSYQCPKLEYVMKFLESNGKNLKCFYVNKNDKALNLTVANFCPKIRKLSAILNEDGINILKTIFINCNDLESIKIWCGYNYDLNEKELLDTIVNYSPNNFHELKMYSYSGLNISPEVLESFFISWKNRTPKKLLTLIFIDDFINEVNLKIIEKYVNQGIIKFWTKRNVEEREDEESDFYY